MKLLGVGAVLCFGAFLAPSCGGSEFSSEGGDGGTTDSGTGGTPGCAPGTKRCGGQCVSREDPAVGCGEDSCSPCFLPQATSYVCQDGQCVAMACEPGFDQCDQSPACENINTHDNCGSCLNACPTDGVCDAGTCASECPVGKQDCSGACADVQTDISNCGSCGKVCVAENAQVSCSAGVCGFNCNSGFDDCNQLDVDGCEIHLLSEAEHCGDCTTVCDTALGQVCESGQCACPSPLVSCTSPSPVCADPDDDPQHCGGCSACSPTELCKSGSCDVPNCALGLDQCNGNCVNLQTDPAHCGQCQNACPSAQACALGKCLNTCVTVPVCDVLCSSFDWDPANCGSCTQRCNPGQACIEGSCIDAVVASHPSDCPEQACPVPGWWNAPSGVDFICLAQIQACPP